MSLPTRERGLKLWPPVSIIDHLTSLPTRERGLKLLRSKDPTIPSASLPTRERGLKHRSDCIGNIYIRRSPRGSVD